MSTQVATDVFLKSFKSTQLIHNAKILDSGCGDGYASKRFVELGAEQVDAVDPFTLRFVPSPKVKFHRYPIIVDKTYDIVWSHHVIEHVHDPVKYLSELWFQLKDTGQLWLGCPNTLNTTVYAASHLHNFTLGNLLSCLQLAKFGTEEIKWSMPKGQLRIRVPKKGNSTLPEIILKRIETNIHFDLNTLPITWNWNG